eukprot:TRINITY_DN834_c0_g1_i3.p1 TRINITY_DN834_c0_g1~~TRINITY_DN834_c0_g1_i3.p1  ORF type:complete len:116 (+),score=25.85 TRINITY_DN834_c0_g1_i3:33-380(+)
MCIRDRVSTQSTGFFWTTLTMEGEGRDDTSQDKTDTEHISLKVVSQDGSEVFFKIKRQTHLKKLMEAYCKRQGVDMNSIRFLHDGNRISQEKTPKELDMEDNDIIDAVLQQTGGY